ncbi:MAG: LON peptidase substrate-binding domain-containing protein, partial [Clostridia bacterium]|nr:LON peptidase substrate-binding domain-containing protein [Clostridia bacterium]
MDNTERNVYAIPVVALRGLVVFPEMVLHFDIARQKSINAIQAAMDYGQEVLLLTQLSTET